MNYLYSDSSQNLVDLKQKFRNSSTNSNTVAARWKYDTCRYQHFFFMYRNISRIQPVELSPMRVTDELCSLALEICLCWWIKWQTLTQLSGSDCSESEWDWDCVDCVGLLPPGGPVHLTIESHCPDVERLSWLPELLVISKAKELNVITGQRSQGSGCPVFTLVCLNIPYSASSCNSPGRILRIHNSFRVSLIFFGLSSQYETPHVEAVQIWHLEIKLQWFFLWPQPDPQSPTDYTPATSTSTLLPPEATE